MTITVEPRRPSSCRVMGTGLVALDRIHIGRDQPVFEELGGSCGNVLISLAMLGRSVVPVLRLGGDRVGQRLEQDLRLAGADTQLVNLQRNVKSPVIAQMLDLATSNHSFSFACPSSSERYGRFQSITFEELEPARVFVTSCALFYTDRISEAICAALEVAAESGAIVCFEPSRISDDKLFERALSAAHIIKYSTDRLSPKLAQRLRPEAFSIVTAGQRGLEVRHAGVVHQCNAIDAKIVRDTCGAGDMVTIGVIDRIIQAGVTSSASLAISTVLDGVRSGQRLAAENCGYVGARGIFRERGAQYVREILVDG